MQDIHGAGHANRTTDILLILSIHGFESSQHINVAVMSSYQSRQRLWVVSGSFPFLRTTAHVGHCFLLHVVCITVSALHHH